MNPPSALSHPPSGDSPHQRVLDAFRGGGKTQALHPREKTILGLVAIHLTFLAWAFGGQVFWAQYVSLGLGAVGFWVALLPREIPRLVDQPGMRLIPWIALRRTPLFWIGLLLMALVAVQGLNPVWSYRLEGNNWWMTRIPYITWLPHGVETDWARGGGPWHTLIIWASAWLTACTVWIGLTRRRALRLLLLTITANGVGITLLGLAERLFGNEKIYWTVVSDSVIFSSFVYKNHAGTWLNLCLGAAVGLAGWYYLRGLRRMEKSNPSGLMVFLALILAVGVFASFARGASLMMLVFLGCAVAAFFLHQFYVPKALRRPVVTGLMLVLFAGALKTALDGLQAEDTWARFNQVFAGEDASLQSRHQATQAALQMLGAHWSWGTGAGSFRYLFSSYQMSFPEIWSVNGGRLFWEHAHNDIVEFAIELGLPGMLLFAALAGAWIATLIRNYFWKHAVCVALVLTLLLTFVHAWWEFVFQCPAILVLYGVLAVVAVQWARFEEGN